MKLGTLVSIREIAKHFDIRCSVGDCRKKATIMVEHQVQRQWGRTIGVVRFCAEHHPTQYLVEQALLRMP